MKRTRAGEGRFSQFIEAFPVLCSPLLTALSARDILAGTKNEQTLAGSYSSQSPYMAWAAGATHSGQWACEGAERRGSGLCQQERRDTIWPGRFNRNRHPGSKPFIVISHSTGSVRSLWDHVGTLKGAQVGCRCLWTHWGQLETGNCTEDRQGKLQDYPTHIQQQAASCLCPCLVTLPGFHIALLSLLGKLPPSGQAVLSASPTL